MSCSALALKLGTNIQDLYGNAVLVYFLGTYLWVKAAVLVVYGTCTVLVVYGPSGDDRRDMISI